MKIIEKIKRWWAPGEYDDELPASEGEGHPLTEAERDDAKDPGLFSRGDPRWWRS